MNLRVIGPLRKATQIELSMTDARALGLTPPIRISVILKIPQADVLLVPREIELEKALSLRPDIFTYARQQLLNMV